MPGFGALRWPDYTRSTRYIGGGDGLLPKEEHQNTKISQSGAAIRQIVINHKASDFRARLGYKASTSLPPQP